MWTSSYVTTTCSSAVDQVTYIPADRPRIATSVPPAHSRSQRPAPAGTTKWPTVQLTLAAAGGTTLTRGRPPGCPTGLKITAAGVISGTPTVSGTFNFSVTVTDSASPTANTATKNLSLTVN